MIDVSPKYLIVGAAKETAAETVLAAINPASASDVNVWAGKLQLIVEPRVTGNTWYLAADPGSARQKSSPHRRSAAWPSNVKQSRYRSTHSGGR